MNFLKKTLEVCIVSMMFGIINIGTNFILGMIIFSDIDASLVSTIGVFPISFCLGPILYYLFLRKILDLQMLVSLIVLNFVSGLCIVGLFHLLTGIGFWLMPLTFLGNITFSICAKYIPVKYYHWNQSINT